MLRGLILLLLAGGCGMMFTGCGGGSIPAEVGDNAILALALTQHYEDGGYTVVSPDTAAGLTPANDPSDYTRSKAQAVRDLQIPGVDVSALVDALALKNARSARLTLRSAPQRGYVVDYGGDYAAYFAEGGGGWERWYEEHPRAHGRTTVSLPAYDPAQGVVLLYMGTQSHWLAGAGYLIAYRYDGTNLTELGRAMLWIS